ncbi:polysaccharide pyruvyl transferase family protein [Bacteroides sp. AN502(2024)]|uniref:polysaccharide pyruvyl transferase family protein n=1 Tax=Bacteroides sp. AN502(2024) TaxID=3160599 RepID=UPI0035128FEC
MRIGILTCWSSKDNYGQQLQCWALQQYLRGQGHQPYLVRFVAQCPSLWKHVMNKFQLSTFKHLISGRRSREKAEWRIEKQLAAINKANNPKREFDKFRNKYIAMSDRIYTTLSELRESPPVADAYITGSDQVWFDTLSNPNNRAWYLDFGSESVLRISYAASIGREILPSEQKLFTRLIQRLDAVSVREQSGWEQCQRASRTDIMQVIDPTLLIDSQSYSALTKGEKLHNEDYIFVYVLNVRTQQEIHAGEIESYRLSKGLKLKTVYSSGYYQGRNLFEGNDSLSATIPEWITLIRDARCVASSSFHGIVFSIIYHRSFVAIPLTGKRSKANARLTSLLGSLGLQERIMADGSDFKALMDKPIDWDDVERRLSALRSKSWEFLRDALSKKKKI